MILFKRLIKIGGFQFSSSEVLGIVSYLRTRLEEMPWKDYETL